MSDISDQVRVILKEIEFHPDFKEKKEQELVEARQRFYGAVDGGRNMPIWQIIGLAKTGNELAADLLRLAFESIYIGKYFEARVRFLTRVVGYINQRRGIVHAMDDGCGTGVDLYCLDKLLSDDVVLCGADPNPYVLSIARQRNPSLGLRSSLVGGSYDVVYSDFFSIDDNDAFAFLKKSRECHAALNEGGVVIQNVDVSYSDRIFSQQFFGGSYFRLVRDELISEIEGNHPCYLQVWEKI